MVHRLALSLLFAGALLGADRASVLGEILPDTGPAWPPYQLAAHAVGIAPGTEADMTAAALARQDRLTALRREHAALPMVDAAERDREILLAYAFGDSTVEAALQAIATAPRGRRLDLARLLLADAEVDAGLALALPLVEAGPDDATADAAARLIAEVVRDRAAISGVCPLVPLRADPTATIDALLRDPAWARRLRGTKPPLPLGEPESPIDIVVAAREEWSDNRSQIYLDRVVDWQAEVPVSSGMTVGLRLDSAVPGFQLHRRDDAWPRRGSVVIDCSSRYHGPIAFALYRCADHAAWERLDPGILVTEPVRTWRETFASLPDCNRRAALTGSTLVDGLDAGWYVITARARGAPVVAAQRVAVSAIQLTVLADHRHAVVVAIDRATGQVVADAGIEVSSAVGDGPRTLVQATTGADGVAEVALGSGIDPLRPLTVGARLTAEAHLSAAESIVPALVPTKPIVQAAAWSAMHTVPPGSEARISGVLRVRDGLVSRLPMPGDELPRLIVKAGEAVVTSTALDLDAHGRFTWTWTVPHDAHPGDYRARIGVHEVATFTVSAADLPGFDLSATMDRPWRRYLAGEVAQVRVRARAWNQLPMPGVALSVSGLPDGVVADIGETTDANGNGSIALRIPADHAVGSWTTIVTAIAPDGSHTEDSTTWSITDELFNLALSGERDPTVGTVARLQAEVTDWSGNHIADVAVRVGEDAERATDAGGMVSLVLPTAAEGPSTATVIATTAAGAVNASWSYTVRPLREQQLERVDDPLVMLDEYRPFVRTAGVYLKDSTSPAWMPRFRVGCHLFPYALADNAPATFTVDIGERTDRERPITALVWASGDQVHAHRVITVGAGETELTLPLDRAWAPAATVSTLILDGDQQTTTCATVRALTPESVLQVGIEGAPDIVRPGQRVAVTLRVADSAGREQAGCAVVCRVLDVADRRDEWSAEGWYRHLLPPMTRMDGIAAATDLPYPSTAALRWWTMGLPTWAWNDDAVHFDGQSSARRCCSARRVVERQDWRRLALWRPDLVTGDDGRVEVAFTVPDRMTTWRLEAWAVADDGAFGEADASLISRLGAAGSLPVPAFVRAGDRIGLRPGVNAWDLGVERATLDLSVRSAADVAIAALRQDALLDQVTRACFVDVPATGTTLHCALTTAVAGFDVDRLRHDLPILPAGERRVRWQALDVDGAIVVDPVRLIGDRKPGSVRCTIELERDPARILVDAVDALLAHPHGCVEQTLSRFLPAVMVARAAGDAPSAGFDRAAIAAVAATGIARLVETQQADGGWGWFGTSATDPALTAMTVEGLTSARAAGLEVPARAITDGAAALARLVDGPLPESPIVGGVDLRLLARLARLMADAGAPLSDVERGGLRRQLHGGGRLRDRCLAGRMLALSGDNQAVRTMLPGMVRSCRPRRDQRESLLAGGEVLLLATAVSPEDGGMRAALARDLLAARAVEGHGTTWGDTYVTATVVRALAVQPMASPTAPRQVVVERRGEVAVTLDADHPRLEWTAVDPDEPIHLIAPTSTPCRMRVEWVAGVVKRAPPGAARIALEVPRLGAGEVVTTTRGEPIELTFVVRVPRPLVNACLTIPLPAGVTVQSGTCPGAVSSGTIADGWCAYLAEVPAGDMRVSLRLIAAFTGDFACPPPRLWPMYGLDPGTSSLTPTRWSVAERPAPAP